MYNYCIYKNDFVQLSCGASCESVRYRICKTLLDSLMAWQLLRQLCKRQKKLNIDTQMENLFTERNSFNQVVIL